jgi:hypothetical protein
VPSGLHLFSTLPLLLFPHAKLSHSPTPKGDLMRLARITACLAFFLLYAIPSLPNKSDKLTVMGKLSRVMAIGAETSGWAIDLNPVLTVNGKQVSSLEVKFSNSKKLEALENKKVKATGTLSNAVGVETGERPVLTISSIKEIKEKPPKDNPDKD